LADTYLICLDRDLEFHRQQDGKSIDPGTGRDAAEMLATQPVVCPLIVHSSYQIAVLSGALYS
jgi:hypothetical protein